MRKRIDWKWQKLDENTWRVKVIGGWLVHHTICDGSSSKPIARSESMVFVPDRDHEWEIMPPLVDVQVQRANIAKDFIAPKAS